MSLYTGSNSNFEFITIAAAKARYVDNATYNIKMSSLDGQISSNTTALSNKVSRSGDTMTGELSIQPSSTTKTATNGNVFTLYSNDDIEPYVFQFGWNGNDDYNLVTGTIQSYVPTKSYNALQLNPYGGPLKSKFNELDDGLTGDAMFTRNVTVQQALNIENGTNKTMGTATLASGVATVSTTAVTSSSQIFLSRVGSAPSGTVYVASTTPGTGFTISSTNGSDAGGVNWWIVN